MTERYVKEQVAVSYPLVGTYFGFGRKRKAYSALLSIWNTLTENDLKIELT